MEKTITTYESLTHSFCVLQYGWKPFYRAYRIKEYKMRKFEKITPASLMRLNSLLSRMNARYSNAGENWFQIVHYL